MEVIIKHAGNIIIDSYLATQILSVLQQKYAMVFAEPGFPVVCDNCQLYKHRIRMKDKYSDPLHHDIYPLDIHELEELEETLNIQLDSYQIIPFDCFYGAPILYAQKKNGKLQLCIDYRALNKQNVLGYYLLPREDDLLYWLYGAHVFLHLDLKDGCHQLLVTPEDWY